MALTGSWKIADLPEHKRYVLYAQAYLDASRTLTLRMREVPEEHNWPNASVALMLAAHATELFLKGAILSRDPASVHKAHRLDQLAAAYFKTFPEPEFYFDMPFQGEYPGFTEEEIFELKKDEPVPSILFRYPTPSTGREWNGIQAFEAQSFLEGLVGIREAFLRIGERI
jgi:hypothetical protein